MHKFQTVPRGTELSPDIRGSRDAFLAFFLLSTKQYETRPIDSRIIIAPITIPAMAPPDEFLPYFSISKH